MNKQDEMILSSSNFTVASTEKTFDYWINQPHIGQQLRQQLRQCNVLLTPRGSHTHVEILHFPKQTEDFLNYFRQANIDGLVVDICIEDDVYKELGLNADPLQLPDILVQVFLAPIAVNLLVEYIRHRLGSRQSKTEVISSITITDETTNRTVTISYNGTDFEKVVAQTLRLVDNSEALEILESSADLDYEQRLQRLMRKSDSTKNNEER